MRDLLPGCVAVAEATPDDWTAPLLPAERSLLGERARPVRRREVAAGRSCARRALAALGLPGRPVPADAHRRPVWPDGVAGSITHTEGYCAAVAVRRRDVRSIGIDAEVARALDADVENLVCGPDESRWCASRTDGRPWSAVIFSAKESVYKLWSPLTGTWLDFHDVTLTVDPVGGRFRAVIAEHRVAEAPGAPGRVDGRFRLGDGLVRTVAVLPAG